MDVILGGKASDSRLCRLPYRKQKPCCYSEISMEDGVTYSSKKISWLSEINGINGKSGISCKK